MTQEEVQKLAALARIELSSEDATSLSHEFDEILTYVDQIKEITADTSTGSRTGVHFNVFREDADPHEPGIYTDDLLAAAPFRDGQYLKVKKILRTDDE